MIHRLPPLNALRAFAAAGRHLSFSRAAQELHVTPAAVSHQIKALEDYLGVSLFQRLNKALRLTEAGQACLPGVREGFERLSDAVEAVKAREAQRPLTVSVAPSFAAKWLVPRLDRFRESHPGIDVRIDATHRLVDLAREDVDFGIRYGTGQYPGMHVERLLAEEVFPVCSPRLLHRAHPLRLPADLRWHTLLHVARPVHDEMEPDWRMWLHAAGVDNVDAARGPQFSIASMAVQAAIEGQGVALAGRVLVTDDLVAGRLVRPFDLGFPVSFAYYLVCPTAGAEKQRVIAFREWLISEAAATSKTSN
ncbi:MAG: transcriptional regulator GcvA [Acidiferrobacterales bacterium]